MNSRGRQPTVAGALMATALKGPHAVVRAGCRFDPSRVVPLMGRVHRGLHPRLFTFQPCRAGRCRARHATSGAASASQT